jgi:hypothetical protein
MYVLTMITGRCGLNDQTTCVQRFIKRKWPIPGWNQAKTQYTGLVDIADHIYNGNLLEIHLLDAARNAQQDITSTPVFAYQTRCSSLPPNQPHCCKRP